MNTTQKVIKVIEDTIVSSAGISLNEYNTLRKDLKMSDYDIDMLATNIEQLYLVKGYLYLSGMSEWNTIKDIVDEIDNFYT